MAAAPGGGPTPQLRVTAASYDPGSETLSIFGVNFGTTRGVVTLNGFPLPVSTWTDSEIQALVSDLQPKATTTGEPAAQLNYAVEPSGPMQAFDHQAQHDLEAGMSDGSMLGIVGIDVHHTATALA